MDFEDLRDNFCVWTDGIDITVDVDEALNGPFSVLCANMLTHSLDKALQCTRE